MDEATTPEEAVFRLVYRSREQLAPTDRRAVLGELFSQARTNNKARHLTGALLLSDGWFVQTLEGEEAVVRELFARIEGDPRHSDVEVVETGTVGQRVFARWAMAQVGGDGEPDVPLIAHAQGISPAAPRGGTTPAQEDVLSVMREAARA